MKSRISRSLWFVAAFATGLISLSPAFSQDYYKGKTITMYVGYPPGGGADIEMRLAAQFLGKHIPGHPQITPMNMPGASGVVLANYLYNIAKPNGLTIGMPGRSGFVLAALTREKSAKYDLNKFNYIGSSGSDNSILWLRKGIAIRSLDQLRKSRRPIVIGGLSSTSNTVVVPKILAKYKSLPLRVVPGYPGTSGCLLALERDEIDGIFNVLFSRPDLAKSGAIVPIFQTYPTKPDLPSIDSLIKNDQERAVLHFAIAPTGLGAPLLGPPGMPAKITAILRKAYTEMVHTPEYRAAAATRFVDVARPNSGKTLQKYVAANLTTVSPHVLQEYLSIVGSH